MAPQTPLLLVDNLFDSVMQYPLATVSASSEQVGHEAFRVADYRRERTSWQATTSAVGHLVAVDLGAGVTRAVDALYIDRGHNLWSTTIGVHFSDDGVNWTAHEAHALPAYGTLGGDPSGGGVTVTEEGAFYILMSTSGAHRWWRFYVATLMLPVVSGLILGRRTQLLGYSTTFDEDQSERTQNGATSTAGVRGTDTTYSWRTLDLGLANIGATEYDATIRGLRTLLFTKNVPAVIAMDWGTRPERAWMYQVDGTTWGLPKTRVYRSGRVRFREVGASLP